MNRSGPSLVGTLLASIVALAMSGVAAGAGAQNAARPAWTWRFDSANAVAGEVAAVARSSGGWIASGGTRGVALLQPGSVVRRFSLRAPVTDLAFDAGNRLWIASANGLFRLDPGAAAPRELSPPSGQSARAVTRVVAAGSEVAVATAAGVFWRRGGAPWQRIDSGVGQAPARALAIVPRGATPSQLWIAGENGLAVTVPARAPFARVHPLPEASGSIVDLYPDGASLWVLTSRSLVDARAGGPPHPVDAAPGAARWRLARAAGEFFLATERGLWSAQDAAGPWRRAEKPAGLAAWHGLAAWPGGLALAGPRGLLVGERAPVEKAAAASGRGPTSAAPCGPDIVAVQRAVLDYLHMRGDPVARMRRGVRKRGWLPELRLQAGYAVNRDRGRKFDQAFVSGGLRELNDWDHEKRRTREASVAMTWELGDLAYHPEEIDVSAEARRLIELRDSVLDEVNQLFFDRERTLRDGGDPLRAARFAAGLDGWSGGWFSSATRHCPGLALDPPPSP